MDYELTRLNSRSFEQLVQALAVNAVAAGVRVFGDGPDDGREATFEGKMDYPSKSRPWSGLLVMQAKFRQHPQGNKTDSNWALKELKKELKKTFAKKSERTRPDYYIFATNVKLSSARGGGKDKAKKIAAEYPLKGFRLWDRDQIHTYLDAQEDVRNAYSAFITSGDVLAELKRLLGRATPDFDRVVTNFLEKELLADQYANLEQAGTVLDEQIPISRVFVDLPTEAADLDDPYLDEEDEGFIATTLEIAAEKLDRKSQGISLEKRERGRLVLIGGPGQGKTTAGQILCQLFRTSILRTRPPGSLTGEAESAMDLMESQCEEEGIRLPSVHRFPIRIALTDLSDRLADKDGPNSLLETIAEIVSSRYGQALPSEVFREWLSIHPWLLVLDGLDEVPASGNRADVIAAIREFWVDATQAQSDLLVVATTRPQGYNDDFSPVRYEHVTLAPLSKELAERYGARLAHARYPTKEADRERITTRLEEASGNSAVAKLMTTPLQVTIMATLVDRGAPPPEQKWHLFSEYYRVMYLREQARDLPASRVLRDHQQEIDAIHRRVALLLQVEGERASHAEARMSHAEFTAIVKARLEEEGHEEPELSAIAEEIMTAASDRLVFLVGLEEDKVGFEIRSLQEFMAAEATMDGDEASVTARLHAIAGVTSWRNVFLFAAGHCFTDRRRHLRDTIVTVCEQLNDPEADPLAQIVRPGSALAVELLEDGVALHQPNYSRLLTNRAMRLLGCDASPWSLLDLPEEKTLSVYAEELTKGLGEAGSVREECMLLLREHESMGAEWARRILDERIPATLETTLEAMASDEDLLIPEQYPEDEWLPERIDSVSGEMSLAQIDEHASRLSFFSEWLPENGASAIAGALAESPTSGRFDQVEIEGLDVTMLSLGTRWIDAQPLYSLDEAIEASDPETFAAARQSASAANDFRREPTAARLATQLRIVAEQVPPSDWDAVAKLSPWPMSTTIQYAEGDPAELQRIAKLAEEGSLGDSAVWEQAEGRWREHGLSVEDQDYEPKVDAPFDDEVATKGFPVDGSAGFSRIIGGGRGIVPVLVRWLDGIGDRRGPTDDVTRWLIKAVEGHGTLERPLPAGDLCRHLSEDALAEGENARYALALDLEWSSELSAEEAAALDRIGRALLKPVQGLRRERDEFMPTLRRVPDELVANWEAGRRSDGLFRLLAIGIPSPHGEYPVDARKVDLPLTDAPAIAKRNPGAAGLLALKGEWSSEGAAKKAIAKMAGVWETEPIWLWEAFDVLAGRLDEPLAEQVARELWEAADPFKSPAGEGQHLRRELYEPCSYLIDRRASGLGKASTWNELGFFIRPQASDS